MGFVAHIIRTFRAGLSDENNKGVEGSFKHGYSLDILGRKDVLTCKQAMASIGPSAMSDLIQFMVPATDGSLYCFGSSGSIWARSGDGAWNLAYSDENGAIKGAAEWKLSDGNNYLFWATNTSIARKILNVSGGAVPWPDVTADHKTTLDAADWHTMEIAAGQLNIANKNYLATYDFDGAFNVAALNIRPGNLIKALEERDDNIVLGSYRQDDFEEGHIWSWVVSALNWNQKKRIPAQGVNALISTELLLLQAGADGEIFFSDFVNAVPLIAVPGGGQVNPDAVAIEENLALFGFYGGDYPGIWSYGRQQKNRPFALNYDYRLSPTVAGSTVTELGSVTVINGVTLASWKVTDGSTITYGIDQVSSTTKASAIYEGLEFDNKRPHLRRLARLIKVITNPLAAGVGISAKFKLDGESSFRYAVLPGGSTTYTQTNATEAEFEIGKPGIIYEPGIELTPSENTAPEVRSVITYMNEEEYEHG